MHGKKESVQFPKRMMDIKMASLLPSWEARMEGRRRISTRIMFTPYFD